jgi:O-antigen ligase
MFQTRILNLTLENHYMSGREGLFQDAYELGLERPWFGQGLCGFKILFDLNYPHNLVLELFCETGAVGVSLLAVMLLFALIYIVRNRRHCDPTIWGSFGLMLTSSMFSGDLYDSRGVFLIALLASQEIVTVMARNPALASRLAIGQIRPTIYSPSPAGS